MESNPTPLRKREKERGVPDAEGRGWKEFSQQPRTTDTGGGIRDTAARKTGLRTKSYWPWDKSLPITGASGRMSFTFSCPERIQINQPETKRKQQKKADIRTQQNTTPHNDWRKKMT